ncbi:MULTISPECIES: tRNA dihydrouridine(20/20a) synthase DusA [Pseudoalteromonas]|uniref:tRNA-dihydrouridine(20/20a) synthase n=1 Tax=Pseudoalteromonas luteoviolacea (strain 2ta16) TaxID=1353533 RepID=V4HV61_PSEL2|nr:MULTISPECIES: tRNA dihydrouridine(20/20a) synthase DusA [Pseudoalteromonas]ESP91804.1 tRNA dihydrouridine synthase A [Pseudoalteromonas luteoviolacea 2ta16]KZN42154.1 tRNA-dihydrouridine synthase A [Pseudoalteromonas luteoviolacea NCIMB 1944]MCG7547352.1 tRNA dihydrouridine(20/20a) synthase DusA [Pseudoalteromonas sp. Of7M-16]
MKSTDKSGVSPVNTSDSAFRRFSVAPMLDWTDRHCRTFHRKLSKHAVLYTEMITTGAIIFGKGDYLAFGDHEMPVALQLGGSDPKALAECARRAQEYGYNEVNLNVGCPSDRVQNGRFGACLMAEPNLVAECVAAMKAEVSIPVTVKTRIGIDEHDSYEFLTNLIEASHQVGCDDFIIHARKAWLQGLSPKENREIPPLDYPRVYQLKQDYPHLHVSINGGVKTLDECLHHLDHIDGVMIGREAYSNPFLLSQIDEKLYGDAPFTQTRHEVVRSMYDYFEQEMTRGANFWHIARHMLGIFQNQPGARGFRRHLSENGHKKEADIRVMEKALTFVPEHK